MYVSAIGDNDEESNECGILMAVTHHQEGDKTRQDILPSARIHRVLGR